jgi:Flp pilus assembly pilin Flp
VSKLEYLWFRLIADRGQTLAEYGILIAVIAVVVILAAVVLGSSVTSLFSKGATKV